MSTSRPAVWSMTIIVWSIIIIVSCTHASFLALGPPAAPDLPRNGRTLQLESNYKHLFPIGQQQQHLRNISLAPASGWGNRSQTAEIVSHLKYISDQDAYWWLSDAGFSHQQPFADEPGYRTWRNVLDYGASGKGDRDDAPAIMRAIMDGNRCGVACNATSTKGAVVYFPPGKYRISSPIIQYYYTVFVGNPTSPPTIVGASDFNGMALIDTDVYLPDGNGAEWWTNQNNFYRQIRNFVLDMTEMPERVEQGPGDGWPVGIHWQVSQACTLQNIQILMPQLGSRDNVQHRGIYMENGSGGFVSDISIIGGRVGFIAGTQQYTARNLRFDHCGTAIEMLWDWSFLWKELRVTDCLVGINASAVALDTDSGRPQSIGSLTILDSSFEGVDQVLIVASNVEGYQANVVIDNTRVNSATKVVVSDSKGNQLLGGGARTIESWVLGRVYDVEKPNGTVAMGFAQPPRKSKALLSGKHDTYFSQEKPQYAFMDRSNFLNALDYGVKNNAEYPNNNVVGLNRALRESALQKKVLVLPAGTYKVDDTVFVPPEARVVGALWSQIMAIGPKFADPFRPKVVLKVGNPGDRGRVEISDIALTNHGATAGAVFMEWNIAQSKQGSAAMWDTIFRVGGASGTGLSAETCHWSGTQSLTNCMASSMMLHVTSSGSIYMENMWFWVADHDVDAAAQTRVNVYGARGVSIESRGPSWVHSASNEHSTLYNWQINHASNLYLGHIQSETPYFQAGQLVSTKPYLPDSMQFEDDPPFSDCNPATGGFDVCRESWALRILDSKNVYLYGGGFYSFFQDYQDTCSRNFTCQQKLVETDYSENIWLYSLSTVGAQEVISPQGLSTVYSKDNINGFSTAVARWAMLADSGGSIGGKRKQSYQQAQDNDGSLDPDDLPCDLTKKFDSLDALSNAPEIGSIWCRQLFIVQILSKMINDSLAKYKTLDARYDAFFKEYEHAFRDLLQDKFTKFMAFSDGPGLKHFSCKANGHVKSCQSKSLLGEPFGSWDVEFFDKDRPGFHTQLGTDLGIDETWLEWPKQWTDTHMAKIGLKGGQTGSQLVHQTRRNAPKLRDDFPVPNPKKLFEKAMANIRGIQLELAWLKVNMKMALFAAANPDDVIQAYSVPVFLFADAADKMRDVITIGQQVVDDEAKSFVLTVLTAIFAVLPLGGIIGAEAAGLASLARVVAAIGDAGNIGLTVVDVIDNPTMAPLSVLGLLAGGLYTGSAGRLTGADFEHIASVREGITGDVAKGLGKGFARNDEVLQRILKTCPSRKAP